MDFKFIKKVAVSVEATYYGDFDIDSAPKAVILNSRQSKTPVGSDPWVVNTIKAARHISANDWLLIASVGMNTWELPLWASCGENGKQVIVAPVRPDEDLAAKISHIADDFSFDSDKTAWIFFQAAEKSRSEKIDWPVRDRIAVEIADIILPVSIRGEGNLDTLIEKAIRNKSAEIDRKFETKDKAKKHESAFNIGQIDIAILRRRWDYIIHWTRTCYGPWPGENSALFYSRLAESGYQYPNNGLATLKNILTEKIIRGSSRNLRGGLKGVAFSSVHPVDIVPLMRWRKRYVRWNFEPYGIAISRNAAINSGIQPVIYGNPQIYERLNDSDKPYFQNEGEVGAWREEKEWRYLGDFDLSSIDPRDMRIIVFKPDERNAFKGLSDSDVISMS